MGSRTLDRGVRVGWDDVSPSQPSKCLWARGPGFWGSLEPSRQPLPPALFWGAWQVCFITGSPPCEGWVGGEHSPWSELFRGETKAGR